MVIQRRLLNAGLILTLLMLASCQSREALRADAGPDFSVKVGEAPRFDGCASSGEIVNYRWKIVSAPDKMSEDAGKMIREVDANCAFTLEADMVVDEVGDWVIELEIRDAGGNTSTDTVTVTVSA